MFHLFIYISCIIFRLLQNMNFEPLSEVSNEANQDLNSLYEPKMIFPTYQNISQILWFQHFSIIELCRYSIRQTMVCYPNPYYSRCSLMVPNRKCHSKFREGRGRLYLGIPLLYQFDLCWFYILAIRKKKKKKREKRKRKRETCMKLRLMAEIMIVILFRRQQRNKTK